MKSIKMASVYNLAGLAILALGLAGCLSSSGGGGDPIGTAAGGGGGGGGGAIVIPVCRAAPTPPVPSAPSGGSCVADASTDYLAADFHVDAVGGNDANNGLTSGTAWQTLSKALASAPGGSVVHVATGNYGILQETVPTGRATYLTLRAAPGALPVLSGVSIVYPAKSAAFIRIVGFRIKNYDYDPNNGALVTITRATDVAVLNATISSDASRGSGYAIASLVPGTPRTINGVALDTTDRVLLKSNCVTGVVRGIQLANSTDVAIQRNYVSPQAETAIQHLSNNTNVLVEDNHIRGMSFTPYCNFIATPNILANCDPATTPLDPNAIFDPHASIVAIRSNDIVIRNNIMHGMGSTAGIRTYPPDITGGRTDYSNITIEGNLIYDVSHPQVIQLTGAGDNITVRNNMIVSRYRPDVASCDGITNDSRFRYETAFVVNSLAPGKDGSGILLHNNILVGGTFFIGALVTEAKNIMWSFAATGTTFTAVSPSASSNIVTSTFLGCGNHPNYFENAGGFFAGAPNYQPSHGQLLNLKPTATSGAVGFGDSTKQLSRLLGNLDSNNFFINDGGSRCAGEQSAGPYEP